MDADKSFKIVSPNLPQKLAMISIFDKSIQAEDSFTMGMVDNGLIDNQTAAHLSFKKVIFNHSDLQQTGMSGVKLKGIDLSTCNLEGLGVTRDDLEGCIVSPEQVIFFA